MHSTNSKSNTHTSFLDKLNRQVFCFVEMAQEQHDKVDETWYSDTAELRLKHKSDVVMGDNAGENKSLGIIDYFGFVGVKNYFSTPQEQWYNGLAESAINSIMMVSRTIIADSRLGRRFWYKPAVAGCHARNASNKEHIRNNPWRLMRGEKHSDAGHGFTSFQKEVVRASIRWKQL